MTRRVVSKSLVPVAFILAVFLPSVAHASCIFTVTSSTFPAGTGPQVGDRITVNPCQYGSTTGIAAAGQATTVQILLQLGATPSVANQATVAIEAAGTVTLTNVTLPAGIGTVRLQVVTQASAPLSGFTVSPSSGTGPFSSTGTITLTAAAPSGGLVVAL